MTQKQIIPRFEANLIIRGKIKCETGLHIGGSKEKIEIGGVDSIVVRSPRTEYPYIPGSSLKGKLRYLTEYATGNVAKYLEKLGDVSIAEEIVRVFGIGANEKEGEESRMSHTGLTRLAIRDAFPDLATKRMWKTLASDANFTEYKAENTIDRLTSAANPRFIERVVEGSSFDFEMVYTLLPMSEDEDFATKANEDVNLILMGLRLLENSALGKSGSRGYGKISFRLATPIWVTANDYREGNEQWKASKNAARNYTTLDELDLDQFKCPIHAE